jgi:molybdopterin/thiamine biosynthesis adenylyltransferase
LRSLEFPPLAWRRAVAQLVRSPERVLVGPTGMARSPGSERILVRRLDDLPRSLAREELRAWREAVVLAARRGAPSAPADLARELGVAPHQRAAFLSLGTGAEAGLLQAALWRAGRWDEVHELVVVGLPTLGPSSARSAVGLEAGSLEAIDAAAAERWSRTIGALTPDAWQRLRSARVTLVGCGRSGSLAAQLLALQGACRELVLIDADRLELANLDAVFGVLPDEVGRRKAEVVAAGLKTLRPDLEVRAEPVWLQEPRGVAALRRAEVIITTVDRDAARLGAALVANAYLRVHLDVGTGVFREGGRRRLGADVRLFLPGAGCVRCAGGLRDEAAARRELLAGATELEAARAGARWEAERAGSLATVNAAAVGCALQLLFDLFEGRVRESRWLRLEWGEDGRLEARDLAVRAGAGCPVCGEPGLGDYRFGST